MERVLNFGRTILRKVARTASTPALASDKKILLKVTPTWIDFKKELHYKMFPHLHPTFYGDTGDKILPTSRVCVGDILKSRIDHEAVKRDFYDKDGKPIYLATDGPGAVPRWFSTAKLPKGFVYPPSFDPNGGVPPWAP